MTKNKKTETKTDCSKRIGARKGQFDIDGDFDADNEVIAAMLTEVTANIDKKRVFHTQRSTDRQNTV